MKTILPLVQALVILVIVVSNGCEICSESGKPDVGTVIGIDLGTTYSR